MATELKARPKGKNAQYTCFHASQSQSWSELQPSVSLTFRLSILKHVISRVVYEKLGPRKRLSDGSWRSQHRTTGRTLCRMTSQAYSNRLAVGDGYFVVWDYSEIKVIPKGEGSEGSANRDIVNSACFQYQHVEEISTCVLSRDWLLVASPQMLYVFKVHFLSNTHNTQPLLQVSATCLTLVSILEIPDTQCLSIENHQGATVREVEHQSSS